MVILFTVVKSYLIYEILVGTKVTIQNRDSAYCPPSLMFSKAREKYVNWKDDHAKF